MKSFLAAVVVGILIISLGSAFSNKIERITDSLTEKTRVLYKLLEEDNLSEAMTALEKSEKEFNKNKVLFEATSDHEELLRIELEFASMREFIKEEQTGDALASCAEIELLLNHLPGNFEVKAENIL